jgi:hypothetical protein
VAGRADRFSTPYPLLPRRKPVLSDLHESRIYIADVMHNDITGLPPKIKQRGAVMDPPSVLFLAMVLLIVVAIKR